MSAEATVEARDASRCIRLTLEYDGERYAGWQRQPNVATVEGAVRDALEAVTGETPHTTSSGRTDAGAHAHGQVVGVRLDRPWIPQRLQVALNAHLADDIAVVDAVAAAQEFHARFDAVTRTYRYVVVPRRVRSPLSRRHAWHVRGDLNVSAMRRAAASLVGSHDFAAFGRSPRHGGSTVRTVHSIDVRRSRRCGSGDDAASVIIEACANAFLFGMMRSIVGTLVDVGRGRVAEEMVARLIERTIAPSRVRVAPAHGLHQWLVTYPDPGRVREAVSEKQS